MSQQKLYTPKEISMMLKLNIQTIWRYFREGKIKTIKIGGGYRVKESDLEQYLQG